MTTTLTRKPRSVVVDRTNVIPNPIPSSISSWATTASGGTVGPLVLGSGYIRSTTTNALATVQQISTPTATADRIQVTAGQPFASRIRARTVGAGTLEVRMQWYDASGTALSTTTMVPAVASASFQDLLVGTGAVPAGAVSVIIILRFTPTAATVANGNTLDLQQALGEPGVSAAGAFFSGSTANTPPTKIHAWTGPVGNSPSTEGHYDAADILTTAQLVLPYSMSRPSPNTVTDIPGSDTAVVSVRRAQKRRGILTFKVDTDAIKAAFEALITQAAAFILTDTDRPAVNMTFALDRAGVSYEIDGETQLVWVAKATVVEQ